MRPLAKVVATCSVAAAMDSMVENPCLLPRADGGSLSGLLPVKAPLSSLSELESPAPTDCLSRFLLPTGLCKGDPCVPKPLRDICFAMKWTEKRQEEKEKQAPAPKMSMRENQRDEAKVGFK